MSEVSREEVIKWLEKSAPVCVCSSNAFEEYIHAVNKAISDMEKLHKIEEIINICDNPCKDCRFFGENGRACIFLKYEEIEKIVRGE